MRSSPGEMLKVRAARRAESAAELVAVTGVMQSNLDGATCSRSAKTLFSHVHVSACEIRCSAARPRLLVRHSDLKNQKLANVHPAKHNASEQCSAAPGAWTGSLPSMLPGSRSPVRPCRPPQPHRAWPPSAPQSRNGRMLRRERKLLEPMEPPVQPVRCAPAQVCDWRLRDWRLGLELWMMPGKFSLKVSKESFGLSSLDDGYKSRQRFLS